MNKQSKMLLASLVRYTKDILLGKSSEEVYIQKKIREWKNILNSLTSRDILKEKYFEYLRKEGTFFLKHQEQYLKLSLEVTDNEDDY